MSRFETSKFVRNPSVMNKECLILACQKLNWKHSLRGEELTIYEIGIKQSFGNEYAIRVIGNQVTYNTYYLGNAKEYVEKLKTVYNELNIEYSKILIINEFKKKGFKFRSNDKHVPNETEKISFYMIGRTKDLNETDPIGRIKFTILEDGTVISDSNYLPNDVNKLAHEAMDNVDLNFSSKRVMTKKEVPKEFRDRVTLSTSNQLQELKRK
jgi:hypothetical protein